MKKTLIASALATIMAVPAANAAVELYNNDGNTVGINGKVAVAVGKETDKDTRVANNGSRIGFTFGHQLQDGWSVDAAFQWGVNGTGDNSGILAGKEGISTTDGNDKLFTNRLANVTLAHDAYGSVTVGKLWSAYYNAVGNTDNGNIWGTAASGAYQGSGVTGTGRINNAIQYNKSFGNLSIAVQTQLQEDVAKVGDISANGTKVEYGNTYGASIVYSLNDDISVAAGASFGEYKAYHYQAGVVTSKVDDTDSIYAIAATYGSLAKDGVYVAGNVSKSTYHMAFEGDLLPDAMGYEFNVAYTMGAIQPYVIYNLLTADDFDLYNSKVVTKYSKQEVVAGVNYNFDNNVTVFIEGKKQFIGTKIDGVEQKDDNGVGVGLTYAF